MHRHHDHQEGVNTPAPPCLDPDRLEPLGTADAAPAALIALTNEDAPGDQAEGIKGQAGTDSQDFVAASSDPQAIADRKHFSTLRAELALAGYGLSRTDTSDGAVIDHALRGLQRLNEVHHVHRFTGDVANYICPHTLRDGFGSPEPGAASRAVNYGSGFFTFVKLRARSHSMVGSCGRAQALPALVRSSNLHIPPPTFGSVAVGSDLSPGATMADPRITGAFAGHTSTPVLNTSVTTPALEERDLLVTIWRDDFAQFEGSAAQLVAEGIAPKGIVWPRARADSRWEANGFKYWLRRTRPEGWKGSMSSWCEVDNWFIRIQVSGRSQAERNHMELMRKSAELQAEFHRCTPAGRREWHADCNRYFDARDDKAFQAFKALIPGLIPPKRGRKAKTTKSGAAQ